MTEFLLFLHIMLFAFSFAFTGGLSIYLNRIVKTGDARAIHTAFVAAKPLSIAGGMGWIATALAGGAVAGAYHLDMAAPWLLASYALFIVLMLTGTLLHRPWHDKVIAASATGGADLDAVLKEPLHKIAAIISAVSVLALVLLMTMQPG